MNSSSERAFGCATHLAAMNNYCVVTVDEPVELTTGSHGVVVPAGVQRFRTTGVVESAGPTVRIPGMGAGLTVLFPPYGVGERATVAGRDVIALLDFELLGYFSED